MAEKSRGCSQCPAAEYSHNGCVAIPGTLRLPPGVHIDASLFKAPESNQRPSRLDSKRYEKDIAQLISLGLMTDDA